MNNLERGFRTNGSKNYLLKFVDNFTEKYQFGTRLELNGNNLDIVEREKLLEVIITNDLKW